MECLDHFERWSTYSTWSNCITWSSWSNWITWRKLQALKMIQVLHQYLIVPAVYYLNDPVNFLLNMNHYLRIMLPLMKGNKSTINGRLQAHYRMMTSLVCSIKSWCMFTSFLIKINFNSNFSALMSIVFS